MDTQIIELSVRGLALVPVVIALTSLVKLYINSYWSPLTSLAFGVAGAYLVGGVTFLDSWALGGIVVGLMASGLYSGVSRMANASLTA